MARSVSVKLEANVGDYVVPVIAATRATEKLDDKVQATNRDMDKVEPASRRAAAAMKVLGIEAGKTNLALNDFGHGPATSLEVIDQRLAEMKTKIRDVAEEFNRTGSSTSLSLWSRLTADHGQLTKLRNDLGTVLGLSAKDAEKAIADALTTGGKEGAKNASASIQGLLSTPVVGPVVTGAIVAGVVAAMPLVGATIAGGAGLGLIGVGIATQIKSEMVTGALDYLTQKAKADFTEAAAPLGPELAIGLRMVGDEIDKLKPTFSVIYDRLAPALGRLFVGGVNFADELAPGLDALTKVAAPVLGELADDLPMVAHGFTDMFQSIARGGPGASLALHQFLALVSVTAMAIGKFIELTEKADVVLTGFARGGPSGVADALRGFVTMRGAQDRLNAGMVAGAAVTTQAALSYDGLASTLSKTTQTADTLAGAMTDKLLNSALFGAHATLGLAEAQTSLSQTLANNGRAIDKHTGTIALNTQAGQQNREAILAVVEQNLRVYDAQIAAGGSAKDAATAYDKNTTALRNQLTQAGYTQAQIDGLIGTYSKVPDSVNTNIATNGLTAAINHLSNLIALINGIPSHKDVVIDIYGNDHTGGSAYLPANHRASGGKVVPGQDYLVGEQGPEIARFAAPATIIPNNQLSSYQPAAAPRWVGAQMVGAGDGAGGNIYLTVNAGIGTDGRAVANQIMETLRPAIHGSFGGDVQAALGRR